VQVPRCCWQSKALDEAPYKLSGAVVKLACITFWSLAFSWTDKPWFLTEGKLAAVLIKPSSWGSQLDGDLHHQHRHNNDATKNYYERGKYGCRNFHVTKTPLFILKVLKLLLFYIPMLVTMCFFDLFSYKIPMHRKCVRLKCVSYLLLDALFCFYVSIFSNY
jgi:hypothetical protein